MNRPLKTAGIGAVALLLASTAAHAASSQNLNMVASIAGASVGVPGTTVSGNEISGPTNLGVRWQGDAIVVPVGSELVSVDWVLNVAGTTQYRLENSSQVAVLAEVDRIRIRFTPSSCCPPSFIGLPDGVVQTTQSFNIEDEFMVPEGNAQPGTLLLDPEDFLFSPSGSFTSTANLAAWLSSPAPALEGDLASLLFWGQPDGITAVNLTEATMSLDVVANFRELPPTTVIPLPAAGWLLLSGIFGLGGLGWMRRRAA